MNFRQERIAKLIREELGKMIEREIETPDALATITEVLVDKKLEHAHVYVSIVSKHPPEETLAILKAAQGRLQYLLIRKINIKQFPRIEFVLDHGLEHAAKIEKLLIEGSDEKSESRP